MGDHLMRRGDYADAYKEFSKALSADPENPNILWRAGSALTHMALREIGNIRHEHLEQATNYINRSIVLDSDILEAHLEYARALGYLALFKPDWDDFRVARRVREELGIVLRNEPKNPDAHFLMGTWHRWVGPVPMITRKPHDLGSANVDSSLYYFRQAVSLDKDNLLYKLELGRTYAFLDADDKARATFNEITDAKNVRTQFQHIVEQARTELARLDGEFEE